MTPFTDAELIEERKRAERLRDLCDLHGFVDGAAAQRAIVNAIMAEQTDRSRRQG